MMMMKQRTEKTGEKKKNKYISLFSIGIDGLVSSVARTISFSSFSFLFFHFRQIFFFHSAQYYDYYCAFSLSLLSRSSSDIRNYYFRFELYILPYHFTVNMVRIFFFHSSLSLYGGKLRTPHIFGFSTNGCKNGEC